MGSVAAEYLSTTDALDGLIAYIDVELDVSEDTLASDFRSSQRDLLANAKHRAEQARALLSDIVHRSLVDQSL